MEQDAAKTNATLETQYNYVTTYPPLSQTATLGQDPHGTRQELKQKPHLKHSVIM